MAPSRVVAFVAALGLAALAQDIGPRGACKTDCEMIGELATSVWRSRVYGTEDEDRKTHSFDAGRTGTVQIITVINTVEDTTSVVTSHVDVHDNYTPPLTNSAGTVMEVHTYEFNGQTKTTTMTYPTPFFRWSHQYGVQRFSDDSGDCVGVNSTIDITTEPQPKGPFKVDPKDPLGWGYVLQLDREGQDLLKQSIGLLPDNTTVPHSEVKACSDKGDTAPAYVAKFSGSWRVVAQVMTVKRGAEGVETTVMHGVEGVKTAATQGVEVVKPTRKPTTEATESATPATKSLGGRTTELSIVTEALGFALFACISTYNLQ